MQSETLNNKQQGARIKRLRKQRGWSQTQLAMKMPTHPHVTSISDWERGKNAPGLRHLIALGDVFTVDPVWIAAGDEDAGDEDEEDADAVLLKALKRWRRAGEAVA